MSSASLPNAPLVSPGQNVASPVPPVSSETRIVDGCRIDVYVTARASFDEYHVTATVVGHRDAGAAADALLRQTAAVLLEHNILPMQEKLYGLTRLRADVLARRETVYRQHELEVAVPISWIEGVPLQACGFVGQQIWGIVPHDSRMRLTTVVNPATGPARLWTAPDFRMLHLPAVRGTLADDSLPNGHEAQARQVFENIGRGLTAHGFRYTEVVRTWIYSSRLLDWYGDLNRIRTAHFRRVGIDGSPGRPFPASTGIQGRADQEECVIDVLAVQNTSPRGIAVTPVCASPRQDQSFNYGSAFSRGMTLDIEGRRTIHISGTASINTAGESTHIDDPEYQSLETLLCIGSILEEQGGTLSNITSATLFCKTPEAWDAWKRVTQLLQVPDFPKIVVQADVCRHDLLVEMEAVAVI